MLHESGMGSLKVSEDGGHEIHLDFVGCHDTLTTKNVRDKIDAILVGRPQVAQVVPNQRL